MKDVSVTFGKRFLVSRKVPLRVEGAGENRYFDLIVREPLKENKDKILPEDDEVQIPVATVSKQYNLIQHHEVLNALVAAVQESGLDPERLKAELTLTEYGELMRFSFTLPNYDFNPGDGHPIVLKVNALNSVDKTTSLDINLSWYRLVCSNGMMYSTGSARFRRIHLISRKPEDIRKFLSKQLGRVAMAQSLYKQWYQRVVYLKELSEAKPSPGQIEHWINDDRREEDGVTIQPRGRIILPKPAMTVKLPIHLNRTFEPHKREVRSKTFSSRFLCTGAKCLTISVKY